MRQKLQKLTLLVAFTAVLFVLKANFGYAATFTVTNTSDSGVGSLRQAIDDANTGGGTNQINFNIPGSGQHIITLQSPLSQPSDTIVINGESQPGTTCGASAVVNVAIDGDDTYQGLAVSGQDSEINGLAFINIAPDQAAVGLYGSNSKVRCSLFGTLDISDTSNTQGYGGFTGVTGSGGTVSGGTSVSDRNYFYNLNRVTDNIAILGSVIIGTQSPPINNGTDTPIIRSIQEVNGNTIFSVYQPNTDEALRLEFFANPTSKNSNNQYDATTFVGSAEATEPESVDNDGSFYEVTIPGTGYTFPTVLTTRIDNAYTSGFGSSMGLGGYHEPNDLAVSMAAPYGNRECLPRGDTGQIFTATYTNNGPNPIDNFVLDGETDGVTDIELNGGTAQPSAFDSNTSIWTGLMQPGETVIFNLTVDIPNNSDLSYMAFMSFSSFGYQGETYADSDPANNFGFYFGVFCDVLADFQIQTTLNEPGLINGQPGSYTFKITNLGPNTFTVDTVNNDNNWFGYFYFPDELTVDTVTDPVGGSCSFFPAADSGIPLYTSGTLVACEGQDGSVVNVNDSFDIVVDITPTNATSSTTVKAWAGNNADFDMMDFFIMQGGGDLFGQQDNSTAIYTGMAAGSSTIGNNSGGNSGSTNGGVTLPAGLADTGASKNIWLHCGMTVSLVSLALLSSIVLKKNRHKNLVH